MTLAGAGIGYPCHNLEVTSSRGRPDRGKQSSSDVSNPLSVHLYQVYWHKSVGYYCSVCKKWLQMHVLVHVVGQYIHKKILFCHLTFRRLLSQMFRNKTKGSTVNSLQFCPTKLHELCKASVRGLLVAWLVSCPSSITS